MKAYFLVAILCLLVAVSAYAQVAVTPSGAHGGSDFGTLDYTLGQVAFTAAVTAQGNVQLGVQQAYLESESAVEAHRTDAFFNLYPNPTRESTRLTYTDFSEGDVITVYDATGRIVASLPAQPSTTLIHLHHSASGIYIVELTRTGGQQSRLHLVVQS
jgi:hypothetical protein